MWPKIHSPQVWQDRSLEFLVTVWQELVVVIREEARGLGRHFFVLACVLFSAC